MILAALAAAAIAVQPVHVINEAHLPAAVVRRMEARTAALVNGPLHRAWGTPRIRFASNGWPVTLSKARPHWMYGFFYEGYHGSSTTPFAVVLSTDHDSVVFAHEVIEMSVDPYLNRRANGTLVEVCDPVQRWPYDFVLPSFYSHHGYPKDDQKKLPARP